MQFCAVHWALAAFQFFHLADISSLAYTGLSFVLELDNFN
jgi:hypothetical protein